MEEYLLLMKTYLHPSGFYFTQEKFYKMFFVYVGDNWKAN